MAKKNKKEKLEEIEYLDINIQENKSVKKKKDNKNNNTKKKINSSNNKKKETKKSNKNKTKVKKEVKKNNKEKIEDNKKVNNKKNIEKVPIKKNKNKRVIKKKVKVVLVLISLIFIFLIASSILLISIKDDSKQKDKEKIPVINYKDYYHEKVKTTNDKKLYELKDGEFNEVGIVYKDLILDLENSEYIDKGYFKIKELNYYIDYKDIKLDTSEEIIKKETYKNYIPFNENVKTIKETKLYLDNKLIYSINQGIEIPILIKENEYYGVIFQDKLFYIKKDECEVITSNNTNLEVASGISALVYHFTYDSTNKDEEKRCKNSNITICLSDTLFKKHLTYMKDNNFYTLTMNDLDLFIDGKVRLPKKSVLITIDDGYFVSAAIKVLEELDLHATLFLIGVAGSPDNYKSDNLEIHSHTYNMHNPGICSGGQGSPLKCLNRELLLEDLRKSREQLNGSDVFCYPFFEYNDYAIDVLKEAGFKMAFIGGRRKIKVGTDKYKLPRYGIINTTTVSDIAKIIN